MKRERPLFTSCLEGPFIHGSFVDLLERRGPPAKWQRTLVISYYKTLCDFPDSETN